MTLRKFLFWTHLAAGCTAGLVILIMSLTGVVLTYQRQILASIERGAFRSTPPSASARHLPVEELLAKVGAQRPLPASATLTLRADRAEPAEITAGRGAALYVNPYTGQVLGSASPGPRQFFQSVTAWHRWFAAEGAGRATARAITGACNLAFLLLVLSGTYLWLPKVWSWRHVRPIAWFRGGLSGKARDFNWHNVFGVWALVPLFLVVLTAVPMSYAWANSLLFQIAGSPLPAPAGRPAGPGPGLGPSRPADLTGLNQLWARAQAQQPEWTSIAMRLPQAGEPAAVFTLDTGDGGQPQKRSTLTLDRSAAAVVRWEAFADNTTGRRWRSYARFLHTGEALGIAGQTAAGLASFAGVMLVWTGLSLSLRRLSAWNARRQAKQEFAETALMK